MKAAIASGDDLKEFVDAGGGGGNAGEGDGRIFDVGGSDDYGGGSDNVDSVKQPRAKEPSIIEKVINLAKEGVPFAGGNITPAKIGRGYGAKWTMNFSEGGKVSKASKRADGIAQRGKTKGRYL